jgi:ANTAR domain/GAF domain
MMAVGTLLPFSGREDEGVDLAKRAHLVEIVAALKEITAFTTTANSLPEAVEGLAKSLGDILPGDVRCGVTVVSEGTPAVFASAGVPDEILDETRYEGHGPCLNAIRTRDIVLRQELSGPGPWPAWSAAAHRHGIRGVLCYPFDVDTLTLGAISLYAERPDALTDDVPVVAMLVADHAGLLLRVRRQQVSQEELVARSIQAGAADAVVERAIGIVMAQRGCSPEQALRHLQDAATHLGVEVTEVAQRLVQTITNRST